jgi:preprotein translocase subunit SecE
VNRETKRMMQRRGSVEADGEEPLAPTLAPPPSRQAAPELSIPGRIVEFGREIRSELRQVAWPTRQEVANSATVVIIVLVLVVALIFLLNYLLSHAILHLLTT